MTDSGRPSSMKMVLQHLQIAVELADELDDPLLAALISGALDRAASRAQACREED